MSTEFTPEKHYTEKISCSTETKRLLDENCVVEYRKHHREFDGIKLSRGFVLRQIIEFYLKS